MNVLVTGAAGFIGFHTAKALLDRGDTVTGFDNLNNYYDITLKEARLAQLRARKAFTFVKGDLADAGAVTALFAGRPFDRVINLAAQAGVRYSLEKPSAYVDDNLVAFANVLEGCRQNGIPMQPMLEAWREAAQACRPQKHRDTFESPDR